jgi:hypothetical protein
MSDVKPKRFGVMPPAQDLGLAALLAQIIEALQKLSRLITIESNTSNLVTNVSNQTLVLNTINSVLSDIKSVVTDVQSHIDTDLSTRASEVTLQNVFSRLADVNTRLDTQIAALGGIQTTLDDANSLLTSINASTGNFITENVNLSEYEFRSLALLSEIAASLQEIKAHALLVTEEEYV